MLSSQREWQFMLLVWCVGTAPFWNRILLPVNGDKTCNCYTERSPSLQSESRQMHFPLSKCGNILLSSVAVSTQDTREECRNTLLKLSACNSGACIIQVIICAKVFWRWKQCLHVTSTAHLNAGHPWIVQASTNEDVITAVMEWESALYHALIETILIEGSQSTSRWSVASVPLLAEGCSVFRDSHPLGTQSCEQLWH